MRTRWTRLQVDRGSSGRSRFDPALLLKVYIYGYLNRVQSRRRLETFLGGKGPPSAEPVWNGTLITDPYAGYNGVPDAKVYPQCKSAACAAHARRRFEELSRGGSSASAVATEAMLRWSRICRTEAALAEMGCEERRHARQVLSRLLWEEFEVWLKLQRTQMLDGSKIAEAIDFYGGSDVNCRQ